MNTKTLTIDFETLPIARRDELLLLINKYAHDNRRKIENDAQVFGEGEAKNDMLKWAEALGKIQDEATKIYQECNYERK